MSAYLHCMSHSPVKGHFDPAPAIRAEVDTQVAAAHERIKAFDPELVVLFSPDHFNGFFYNIMPAFCIGMNAYTIGDFGTAKGRISVPTELAEQFASYVIEQGIDTAVSYDMQVDHGFGQPLDEFVGGLDVCPVIPIFINSVAVPLPTFQRARLLGEAVGRFARSLDKRVLILGSGGLSHQPPVPELATANEHMRDRLLGSGFNLPPEERELRTQRTIAGAARFVEDQNSLYPLNPEWDNQFLDLLEKGNFAELDNLPNDELSRIAGKSTHEVKCWLAAFAALSQFGPYQTSHRYYREIPEWIAGFGGLSAHSR